MDHTSQEDNQFKSCRLENNEPNITVIRYSPQPEHSGFTSEIGF